MLCLSGFELYSRWVHLKEVGKAWHKSNMRKPYTSFSLSPSYLLLHTITVYFFIFPNTTWIFTLGSMGFAY